MANRITREKRVPIKLHELQEGLKRTAGRSNILIALNLNTVKLPGKETYLTHQSM